jgi:DNA-directed RNA polymerase subunit RPC12/RpoP
MTRFTATRLFFLLALSAPFGNIASGQEPKKDGARDIPPAMAHKVGANDPAQAERVEFLFRDGIAKHPMLSFLGDQAESMAVVQPQGLRFNVPAGRAYTGEVGIESRLRLRNDFEITLEYELAALPNPPPPLGVGAMLQIVLDTPGASKARMDRLHRPADDVFGANYIIHDDFQGLAASPANPKETKGQLRMVRTGKMLSYQVQEGGPGFYEIATKEIELADVVSVQALCVTGWQPVALGVRFPRLVLRSSKVGGALVVEPATDLAIAPQSSSGDRSSLLIVIGLGAVFTLVAIAAIVLFMWKRGATTAAKTRQPAAAAAQPAVIFTCSDCGKKLNAKPELAGKKLTCPQCGKMVRVLAGGDKA